MKTITRSRRMVDLLNPNPAHLNLNDISQALVRIPRYAGHCDNYSVAAHSLVCCKLAPSHLKAAALLHDAAEAYTGDVIQPVKDLCADFAALYNRIERKLLIAIEAFLGVPFVEQLDEAMRVDHLVGVVERVCFFGLRDNSETVTMMFVEQVRGEIHRLQAMDRNEVCVEFMLELTTLMRQHDSLDRKQTPDPPFDYLKPSEN